MNGVLTSRIQYRLLPFDQQGQCKDVWYTYTCGPDRFVQIHKMPGVNFDFFTNLIQIMEALYLPVFSLKDDCLWCPYIQINCYLSVCQSAGFPYIVEIDIKYTHHFFCSVMTLRNHKWILNNSINFVCLEFLSIYRWYTQQFGRIIFHAEAMDKLYSYFKSNKCISK